MRQDERILSMWRYGMNTAEIAASLNALRKTLITEAQIHKIITAEREARLFGTGRTAAL